jgi:hypothetical protein
LENKISTVYTYPSNGLHPSVLPTQNLRNRSGANKRNLIWDLDHDRPIVFRLPLPCRLLCTRHRRSMRRHWPATLSLPCDGAIHATAPDRRLPMPPPHLAHDAAYTRSLPATSEGRSLCPISGSPHLHDPIWVMQILANLTGIDVWITVGGLFWKAGNCANLVPVSIDFII